MLAAPNAPDEPSVAQWGRTVIGEAEEATPGSHPRGRVHDGDEESECSLPLPLPLPDASHQSPATFWTHPEDAELAAYDSDDESILSSSLQEGGGGAAAARTSGGGDDVGSDLCLGGIVTCCSLPSAPPSRDVDMTPTATATRALAAPSGEVVDMVPRGDGGNGRPPAPGTLMSPSVSREMGLTGEALTSAPPSGELHAATSRARQEVKSPLSAKAAPPAPLHSRQSQPAVVAVRIAAGPVAAAATALRVCTAAASAAATGAAVQAACPVTVMAVTKADGPGGGGCSSSNDCSAGDSRHCGDDGVAPRGRAAAAGSSNGMAVWLRGPHDGGECAISVKQEPGCGGEGKKAVGPVLGTVAAAGHANSNCTGAGGALTVLPEVEAQQEPAKRRFAGSRALKLESQAGYTCCSDPSPARPCASGTPPAPPALPSGPGPSREPLLLLPGPQLRLHPPQRYLLQQYVPQQQHQQIPRHQHQQQAPLRTPPPTSAPPAAQPATAPPQCNPASASGWDGAASAFAPPLPSSPPFPSAGSAWAAWAARGYLSAPPPAQLQLPPPHGLHHHPYRRVDSGGGADDGKAGGGGGPLSWLSGARVLPVAAPPPAVTGSLAQALRRCPCATCVAMGGTGITSTSSTGASSECGTPGAGPDTLAKLLRGMAPLPNAASHVGFGSNSMGTTRTSTVAAAAAAAVAAARQQPQRVSPRVDTQAPHAVSQPQRLYGNPAAAPAGPFIAMQPPAPRASPPADAWPAELPQPARHQPLQLQQAARREWGHSTVPVADAAAAAAADAVASRAAAARAVIFARAKRARDPVRPSASAPLLLPQPAPAPPPLQSTASWPTAPLAGTAPLGTATTGAAGNQKAPPQLLQLSSHCQPHPTGAQLMQTAAGEFASVAAAAPTSLPAAAAAVAMAAAPVATYGRGSRASPRRAAGGPGLHTHGAAFAALVSAAAAAAAAGPRVTGGTTNGVNGGSAGGGGAVRPQQQPVLAPGFAPVNDSAAAGAGGCPCSQCIKPTLASAAAQQQQQ